MKKFLQFLAVGILMFISIAISAQETVDNPSSQFGVNVGYVIDSPSFSPELDLGVIVKFGEVALKANYIFDLGDDEPLDFGAILGVGKQVGQYTVFANVVLLDIKGDFKGKGDVDIGYGIDVYYNLNDQFAVSVGVETDRGVRLGGAYSF